MPAGLTLCQMIRFLQEMPAHTDKKICIFANDCGISTSVVHWLPKPRRRVRLPYPALFLCKTAPDRPKLRNNVFNRYYQNRIRLQG